MKTLLLTWFLELITRFRLNVMKRRCNYLYKATGKQHLIIPVDNWKRGRYTIVNNESHAAYNRTAKKLGKPQINYVNLLKIAVYKTKSGSL